MRAHAKKSELYDMIFEYKIIANRKKHNIQYCICASAGCITECLQREPFFEKRIKKVYQLQDIPPYAFVYIFHQEYSGLLGMIILG